MSSGCRIIIFMFNLLPNLIYGQISDSLASIFKYNRVNIPDYVVDSSFIEKGVLVERIKYVSTDSFLVSAYITHPLQNMKNNPLIIFNHWGEGDKTEFLEEAIYFSSNNFLCILPDGPWLCPNTPIQSFTRQGYEMYRQYVMNARTAIDLAEQQFKIDTTKIFCVGHSFGCNTAVILSAIDKRIDYFVFMAGAYSTTENMEKSKLPEILDWKANNPGQFNSWIVRLRPLNADLYLPYKTVPSLIQVANNDEYISREENYKFINNTPSPGEVKTYECTHIFNKKAQEDRMQWILRQLK